MKTLSVALLLGSLFAATPADAQAPPVWQAVAQAAFDPAKAAKVSDIVIVRDRFRIVLQQGSIQFSQPAEGVVFAAAFRGTGRIEATPPNDLEARQLRLFTGKTEFVLPFTEAVFSFTDGTYDEIAAKVNWDPAAADPSLQRSWKERLDYREEFGGEVLPRLVKGVLSANKKETEFFYAEMKTAEKSWVLMRLDALDPEEMLLGRWTTWETRRFVDIWMHFPRGNRTSEQAWKDPIAREDVLPDNYQIHADVTKTEDLQVRTVFQLKPRWNGERVVNFFLDSNLRVESVKDSGSGQSLAFAQPQERKERAQSYGDYIAVFFPEVLATDKTYTLEFVYGGRRVVRNVGQGAFFCQSFGWYPTRQNFALRSNFEMNFRSQKKFIVTATGTKTAETEEQNAVLTTWKSEKPIAVAGFAFGEVRIEKSTTGRVEIEIYANKYADNQMRDAVRITEGADTPASFGASSSTGAAIGNMSPASMAPQIAQEMANSVRLFEDYFGPHPYKRLSVSTIPYSYGQGWPSLIYLSALSFMDSFQRKQFGISARGEKELTDAFRAHEVSHQWWGHKVAWKSYRDQWLSEGFAEFSGNLYLQKRSGSDEYVDRWQQTRKRLLVGDQKGHQFDSVGPIWLGQRLNSTESPIAYQILVYEKGGFVLHMLRMMMFDSRDPSGDPERRFKAMMRDFTQTYDNRAASTGDFKTIAEKHMTADMNLDGNGRLDWFFNQYVYGTGIPTYDFKYSVNDAGGGQWKFTGTVTQSGVPEGWKDVLPLYVEMNKNIIRVGNVNIMQRVTSFEIPLPAKPTRFILCRNEDNIGTIKQ